MTQASPATILEVNNIEVIYNKVVQALRGLSLAVPRGHIVALLGSNGAGKSTTLKAISGLLPLENGALEAGSITFNGQSTTSIAPQLLVRRGLSHVMEGRRVFEDLTIEENLIASTYALSGREGTAKPDFDLVYEYFPRLHERRKGLAGYLSGGEQQMLAIGRALIAQPELILLDEPSLGLSPKLTEDIFGIIARINAERGTSMLLVEQNATVALAVAHSGYIMENGKIVIDGSAGRSRGAAGCLHLGIPRQVAQHGRQVTRWRERGRGVGGRAPPLLGLVRQVELDRRPPRDALVRQEGARPGLPVEARRSHEAARAARSGRPDHEPGILAHPHPRLGHRGCDEHIARRTGDEGVQAQGGEDPPRRHLSVVFVAGPALADLAARSDAAGIIATAPAAGAKESPIVAAAKKTAAPKKTAAKKPTAKKAAAKTKSEA